MPPARISRPPGREWIETLGYGVRCSFYHASPGPRAGSGLKPRQGVRVILWDKASPGPRAGSGLKLHGLSKDPLWGRASPGPRAGSGLKPEFGQISSQVSRPFEDWGGPWPMAAV